jgi:stress-induced morphogen
MAKKKPKTRQRAATPRCTTTPVPPGSGNATPQGPSWTYYVESDLQAVDPKSPLFARMVRNLSAQADTPQQQYVERARRLYHKAGEIEIEDDALVSTSPDTPGAYVMAWVWVDSDNYEGAIEVCAHRVVYSYWDMAAKLTDELKHALETHAEERAKECIIDGCHAGELNCYWHGDDGKEEEIRGWWEIDRT